jgi:hypothetical protein
MRPQKASAVVAVLVAACLVVLGGAWVAVAQEAGANTWAGVWTSDFGELTLDAGGSGSYAGSNPGTVTGHVTGNVDEGNWNQPGTPPKQGTFKFTRSFDGKSFSGEWHYDTGGCGSACGWNGTCKAGPCMDNGVAQTTTTVAPTTSTTQPSFATVESFSGDVTFRAGGGPPQPLTPNTRLGRGDELQTGVDASVRLKFADGTIMTLDEMTQVLIADLLSKGSRQAVTVNLALGRISSTVNPRKAFQADYQVRTQSGTTSSRGTVFSVLYEPAGRVTVVSTKEGAVSVDPDGAGLATTMVGAGKELVVRPTSMSGLQAAGTYERGKGKKSGGGSSVLVALGAVLLLGLAAAGFIVMKRRGSTAGPE